MIENYIEKDIMRQIKLTEYFFELKRINIQKVAEMLSVSQMTIKRDIEKILFLDSRIQLIDKNSVYVTVDFLSGITRYELIKKIYKQSYFLRISSLYLMNERNYLKIAEKEHLSVAKEFSLKKKVEDFFKNSGIMSDEGKFIENEFKFRLIMVTIWMRINILDEIVDRSVYTESERIVERFRKNFSNELKPRETYFFKLNIYLTLKRKDKDLKIPEPEFTFIYKGSLYNQIESLLNKYELDENEIAYIAIIYRFLDQNLKNYHFLKIDYQQSREANISQIPELLELVHLFEQTFRCELLKDIIFERPFMKFLMSIFLNRSMFLVEKHYYLSDTQRKLCKEVKDLMTNWSQKHDYQVFLENHAIEKFCLQTSGILLKNTAKKWYLFIVADDEIAHIAYREWIQRRLNTEHIVLDAFLYYSLNELPVYIDISRSIIICERSLGEFPFEKYHNTKIFPVSLFSINEDLDHIFDYIFNAI
ncbi:helix-turn-helix domain-containing protein [Staphylococcus aureus]|uniref:helix-turn-helix domain-containing protein n=1 Tax=Staphylococcus aureus TaxID=1280 RepID=UPI00403FD286